MTEKITYNPALSLRDSLRETLSAQRKLGAPLSTGGPSLGAQRARGLVASARRLTQNDSKNRNERAVASAGKPLAWQEEAWETFDLVGELSFVVNTLAGRLAQAALYVGKTSPEDSPGSAPERAESNEVQRVLDMIGGGPVGMSQILFRSAVNLSVPGELWIVGIPPEKIPGTPEHVAATSSKLSPQLLATVNRESVIGSEESLTYDALERLQWRALSMDEISVDAQGAVKIILEDGSTVESENGDDLYMIRVWRPHPRRAWEASSPVKSNLPVLRELIGLTMHVSAQIDSRLAGAGLLVVSTEASASLKRAAGLPESSPEDPLLDALLEAMMTPIKDRSSASAVVPLVVTVPASEVDHVKHLEFSGALDKEAKNLRDETIRRLSLGLDAPPELLLGVGGMNHWGAWLVQEDVVKAHLEPPLGIICDALTTEFLRPVLESQGMSPEDAREYVVWYDVDHLIERPNKAQDAKDLYALGLVDEKTVREASGFEEDNAPEKIATEQLDPAVDLAMKLVQGAPSLLSVPGLPAVVEQIKAALEGRTESAPAPSSAGGAPAEVDSSASSGGDSSTEGGTPATSPSDAPSGTPANP